MKTQRFLGLAIALILAAMMGGAVHATTSFSSGAWSHVRSPITTDDLVFIHHSCGENWLDNSLDAALLAKDYIDERNGIYYGTDVSPDAGRPDSLQQGDEPPGDHTNMNHWLFWFNDYLEGVKGHGAATGFNRVIMFASCYPVSNISGDGTEPGDPFSSSQTLANYKAVYRHFDGPGHTYSHDGYTYKPLEDIFAENPDVLFIPITAPPMHYAPWDYTSDAKAHRAREFNEWLKNDWLAGYNAAHPGLNNVAVFDWFDVLAYSDDHPSHPNRLKAEYGGASGDSHLNDAANVYSTHVFAADPDSFIDSAWNAFMNQEIGPRKVASARRPQRDQTVTYTVIVKDIAAPLTATVHLTDVVPVGLAYAPGTLAATAGIVTDTAAPTLTWAGLMPFTSAVTVTYAVTVTSIEPQVITSTAVIVAPGYQTSTAATIFANWHAAYLPLALRAPVPPDAQAPSEPRNLSAIAMTPHQVGLLWTASTDNREVEGYYIYRGGSEIALTTRTVYTDTGLEPLTQYTYTVAAYDAMGNKSGQSEPITATTPAASGETLSYVDLARRLTDLEYLATLPQPGEEGAQWSSYGRASRYDPGSGQYIDWSSNADAFGHIRQEGGKYVLAEMQGPGVISRIWSARAKQGQVEVYLDGVLAVDLPFAGYFDGSSEPFTRSALVHETARGLNNYVPIPYQESCKILAEEDWGAYYHFNYTTYPQGTILPTFNPDLSPAESEALDNANSILANGGSYPNYEGEVTEQAVVTIAPGETARILQLDGNRAITAIKVSADFPGSIGRDEFYSYWYMPFTDTAVLELTNDGIAERTLTFTVKHVPLSRPVEGLGRFHAKWHRDAFLPTEPGREIDWTLLKTEGRGRYCGTMLHVWNPIAGWWGEGDEKFFIDGEKFPSIFGTGSEDYFGYAWGSPRLFSNGYHNQTLCEGANGAHTSVNRWHIADNVPFQQSFEGAIEKYFPNDRPTLYAAVAYWYLAPGGIDYYRPLPVGERTGYWPGTQKQKALRELALSIFWDGETSPSVWAPLGDFFGSAPGVNDYDSFPMGMRANVLEGEELTVIGMTGGNTQVQDMSYWGSGWSGAAQLRWTNGAISDTLDLSLPATEAGEYKLNIQLTKARDYAVVQLYLDGNPLGGPIDLYNDGTVTTGRLDMGVHTLSASTHTLSVEIVGANPQAVLSHTAGIDYLQLKPESGVGDTSAPSVTQNLSATVVSANQIDLTWKAAVDDVGVAGYRVFRNGDPIVTTVLTGCSDTGLIPSTQYTYTVAAYDAAGNESAHSEPVTATTEPPRLVLHGIAANEAIHLNWAVNATLPVTSSWHIDYYSQTVTSALSITDIISPSRAYTLTGLSNGTWYTVTLSAMLESSAFLTDTVRAMPAGIFVYLPLALRE
ncbi:MAG: DUF2961 domain-containing protein [Anaerolineae bacterium]